MKPYTKYTLAAAAILIASVTGIGIFAWSGIYNVGADAPHWPVTLRLLTTVRNQSIQARAGAIKVQPLGNDQLILKGAGQYSAMCVSCHLAPGVENTELRRGLYPEPPNLSKIHVAPADAFWVIKHGIKMSAMPAWGTTHDDATIWSMVAFLQKLPQLTPAEYKAIVAKAPPDTD